MTSSPKGSADFPLHYFPLGKTLIFVRWRPRRTLVCRSWSSSPINEIIFSSHFQACHKGYGLVIEKGSRTNWFRYQELIVSHRIFSLSLPVLCTIFFADIWPQLQRKKLVDSFQSRVDGLVWLGRGSFCSQNMETNFSFPRRRINPTVQFKLTVTDLVFSPAPWICLFFCSYVDLSVFLLACLFVCSFVC